MAANVLHEAQQAFGVQHIAALLHHQGPGVGAGAAGVPPERALARGGGIEAAVKMAEGLVHLGLKTSKINAFASPLPKARPGWPIS